MQIYPPPPRLPLLILPAFNLDFYTEVLDLHRLMLAFSEDPFFEKYRKLNEALCDVVQEYSLVSFYTLNVQVCMDRIACVKRFGGGGEVCCFTVEILLSVFACATLGSFYTLNVHVCMRRRVISSLFGVCAVCCPVELCTEPTPTGTHSNRFRSVSPSPAHAHMCAHSRAHNSPHIPLCVQTKDIMVAVTNAVDKANGYCYGSVEGADQSVFEIHVHTRTH